MSETAPVVLVIDDLDDNLLTARALLLELSPAARVLLARTAAEGLAQAASETPDVILLDIVMPDMDGYAVCEILKANPNTHDIPVVFFTALRYDKASRIRALQCGAEAFLNKPLDPVEFEATLNAMLKIRRAALARMNEEMKLRYLVEARTKELSDAHRATLNALEELRLENEARKRSEEYFRRVSAITSDIAYSCARPDVESRYAFEWITGAAERITGYSADEIKSRRCWKFLVHPDDESRFDEHVIHLSPNTTSSCLLRLMHRDGHVVWVESNTQCVPDPSDPHRHVLYGGLRDITERREAEEQLIAAKNRAEHSEKLKDAFVANISHEIRTPLNVIMGYVNVVAERFGSYADDVEREFFNCIDRGSMRLMRTVDMILNMSRLQAGEFTVKPRPLHLEHYLHNTALEFRPAAVAKGLRLITIFDCDEAVVKADEHCVVQALGNLIDNAIKFTISGEVVVRLYVDERRRPCISVRDTGIGISRSYVPLLFTRYSQEKMGYTRPYEGLGLGLALAKEYLELNAATIQVESMEGRGSTFTIIFKESADAVYTSIDGSASARDEDSRVASSIFRDSAQPDCVQMADSSGDNTAGSASILLVEDDGMTIDFMRIVLEPKYTLSVARTAGEAWNVLRSGRVNVIIMDISLADETNGIVLTQEIRKHPSYWSIPIVVVTAHAFERDRDRCLNAGCDDFMRKPISTASLLTALERHITNGRSLRATNPHA